MGKLYVFELFKEMISALHPDKDIDKIMRPKVSTSERFGINAPSYLDEEEYLEEPKRKEERDNDE